MIAITIESSASNRKIRQKRRFIDGLGLGTGSGLGMLPFGVATWDYQADRRRVFGVSHDDRGSASEQG
jgi:hypothetical protein